MSMNPEVDRRLSSTASRDHTKVHQRVIGSDFAAVSDDFIVENNEQTPPWELEGETTEYFQTGRQALGAVEALLRARGYTELAVPTHLCDSMLVPFTKHGWNLHPVKMSADVSIDHAHLHEVVNSLPGQIAVLCAEYFGRIPSPQYEESLRKLKTLGIPIIEDETHRVFAPGRVASTYAVGSLRKLLPVADGAYLRHKQPSPLATPLQPNDAPKLRWEAMDVKQQIETTGSGQSKLSPEKDLYSLFQYANARLEQSTAPAVISERSFELIHRFDYKKLAERRRQNAKLLSAYLAELGVRVINSVDETSAPSHLIITVANPKALQKALAEEHIFCPIHWGRSHLLPQSLTWNEELLSIPVDHRYDDDDMQRIWTVLKEVHPR